MSELGDLYKEWNMHKQSEKKQRMIENTNKLLISGLSYIKCTIYHFKIYHDNITIDYFPVSGKWTMGLGKKGIGFNTLLIEIDNANLTKKG